MPIEDDIRELEQRAEAVRKLLRFANRAFVIEFAGTPKSGKSTSVEAVRHFLTRNGFRVHVLIEPASICPIPMKGHLFFNTWCTSTMLADLIANVDTETDVIILDRGLFDSLVWLTLQAQRGELTAAEARTIEDFLLLERWRNLIDLAVVMNVSAEEAIGRENSQRISSRPGSIMNIPVLETLSRSVSEAVAKYGEKFGGVIEANTTGQTPKLSNVGLAGQIIDRLDHFLAPEILVVPRTELDALPLTEGGEFSESTTPTMLKCISESGRFVRRPEAEDNSELVQIVSCGLLTHENKVFVFNRTERDPKYQLYGKATIWQGTHVVKRGDKIDQALLEYALMERITRSLFLSRVFPLHLAGYCWDKDDEKSNRHFGVVSRVKIDNDHTAADLRKKEFRSVRGHGLAGGFMPIRELSSGKTGLNLESWSVAILNGLKNLPDEGT